MIAARTINNPKANATRGVIHLDCQISHVAKIVSIIQVINSVETLQPAPIVAPEPAAFMVAELPCPSIADPAVPGAELTGGGCLVAGSAVEEEAKQATGLTPIVNHMVESAVRIGRPICTKTGLIDFVTGGAL